MRYKMLNSSNFTAVLFAMFHLYPLEGEATETKAVYYNRSVRDGIVYG